MNPDLLEQLRGLLGPSRTASTPLPPVMVTAPARQPTMGPRGTEPSYAPPTDRERMVGTARDVASFVPLVGEAQDVASAVREAVQGNMGGAAASLLTAGMGALPLGDVGRGMRRGFEAWHGSPVRGITRFDPDMSSPGVIAGKGTYVAGDDVFGAGRRQATGYIGGPQSYMSAGGRPAPIGNPMVHDIMESLGYSRPAALQATSAYSRVSANTPLPSGKVFSDDQWQAYTENLRDAWLDELSRRAERGTMPETLAAQQAAQAVARGDIAANRGALYRLNIDADPERMLNRDAAIDEQPEYVSQMIQDIQQQLGYAPRMKTAQGFFNVLQNETDPDEAVRLLLERGIQGIRADAGDYPVSRAALEAGNASPQMRRSQMAPSTQYTIFDPERIRILDMLAPALAAGGLGAYVANQPAVPDA